MRFRGRGSGRENNRGRKLIGTNNNIVSQEGYIWTSRQLHSLGGEILL